MSPKKEALLPGLARGLFDFSPSQPYARLPVNAFQRELSLLDYSKSSSVFVSTDCLPDFIYF